MIFINAPHRAPDAAKQKPGYKPNQRKNDGINNS